MLGEPISLEETLDAVAQAAADALGGSSAAVLMPGTDDLRLAGLHGLPAPLVRFLEQGLSDPADPLRTCARRRMTTSTSRTAGRPATRWIESRYRPTWTSAMRSKR